MHCSPVYAMLGIWGRAAAAAQPNKHPEQHLHKKQAQYQFC
jgi:hypothetical protein